MRIVLDTNVLIAALIAHGACAELLEYCVLRHTIVASEFILTELRRNLTNKFNFTDREADEAIQLFQSQMEIVMPIGLQQPACRDKDDD